MLTVNFGDIAHCAFALEFIIVTEVPAWKVIIKSLFEISRHASDVMVKP